MQVALQAARSSADEGEVPVGAVVVHRPKPGGLATVVARSHNRPIGLNDPTAHAEMLALRAAAQQMGNYRLDECELYVTLEPCAMCAQALLHARVRRVIFGTSEPKTGAAGSVLNLFAMPELNHQTSVCGGVLAESAAALMQAFFQQRRRSARQDASPLRDDALRAPDRCFAQVWESFPDWQGASHCSQAVAALEGLRLHWLDLGPPQGDVWLGLHNAQGWWPQLVPWVKQQLASESRVLLPDLPGFGQSDKPKKAHWHSLDKHAHVIWDWLSGLGVNQLRLGVACGQSQLAQAVIRHAPERVLEVRHLPADALTTLSPDWASAPYPDAGHRAAQRAWTTHGWSGDVAAGQ